MPQRKDITLNELDRTLQPIIQSPNSKHVVLAGDFNCPDINWETATVPAGSPDREIQEHLVDIMATAHLSQMHDSETRENKLLDLEFTTNPTLVKSSVSIPGISDHDVVVTDIDAKPHYNRQKPRTCQQFSKANWKNFHADLDEMSTEINSMYSLG